MKRLFCLCICVGLLLFSGCAPAHSRYTDQLFDVFDTIVVLTADCQSAQDFEGLRDAAFSELRRLSQLYDIYTAYADLQNLHTVNLTAAKAPVSVAPELLDLLLFCKQAYTDSGGTVNVAMGTVLSLWHAARADGVLPDAQALQAAAQHTNLDDLVIDAAAGTVFFADPQLQLDVGAVAKGYAVEQVAAHLDALGYTDFVLSAGGNVLARGGNAQGEPWQVGVQSAAASDTLLRTLAVSDQSVVTSGGYQRYVELDGVRYHHIIDPQTLYPAQQVLSATVIHADSGMADVLSTACFVLPPEQAIELAARHDAQLILELLDGTVLDSATS